MFLNGKVLVQMTLIQVRKITCLLSQHSEPEVMPGFDLTTINVLVHTEIHRPESTARMEMFREKLH